MFEEAKRRTIVASIGSLLRYETIAGVKKRLVLGTNNVNELNSVLRTNDAT
jgi:hypothetical protein